MTGYPYQSWSRTITRVALGMFVGAVLLSLSCIILGPLLPVFLGVTGLALLIVLWLRWMLFRFRGW